MKQLFTILEMFVRWITDCLFDFCGLPFSIKRPLPEGVASSLNNEIKNKNDEDAASTH